MSFKRIKEIFGKAVKASEDFDKLVKSTPEQLKSEITLLDCPFCGGKAKMDTYSRYFNAFKKLLTGYYVKCTRCKANTTIELNESDAADNWNRRCHHGNGDVSEL